MAKYIDKDALVAEIERMKDEYLKHSRNKFHAEWSCGTLDNVLSFIDILDVKEVDLQEEPQVKESAEFQHVNDMCKEKGNFLTQEPVSEELEKAAVEAFKQIVDSDKNNFLEIFKAGANWQKKRDYIPLSDDINEVARQICNKVLNCEIDYMEDNVVLSDEEECVKAGIRWQMQKEFIPSKDLLEELINNLSKCYPEVSFAKLSRIAVRVAKWQQENLWKSADGDDLPEIDREVIVLIEYNAQHNIHDKEYSTYSVGFAHRPPEYWDGKNIVTGKVTRNYPKTYDKGGWNIPDVKYWLDCSIPKEIEL